MLTILSFSRPASLGNAAAPERRPSEAGIHPTPIRVSPAFTRPALQHSVSRRALTPRTVIDDYQLHPDVHRRIQRQQPVVPVLGRLRQLSERTRDPRPGVEEDQLPCQGLLPG